MDLLGKARKLESTIARRFDRAARDAVGAVTREPLEIVHLVVDAIEHEIQPGGRGKRVFPFNSITLSVLASSLEHVTMDVPYVTRATRDWRYPEFNLVLARVARAPTNAAPRDPVFA